MRKRLTALGLAGVLTMSLGACDVDPIDPADDPGLTGTLPADDFGDDMGDTAPPDTPAP